jgi:hypothetical protein
MKRAIAKTNGLEKAVDLLEEAKGYFGIAPRILRV